MNATQSMEQTLIKVVVALTNIEIVSEAAQKSEEKN